MEAGIFPATLFQALPLRIFGIMQNDTLLAIPFLHADGDHSRKERHGRRPAGNDRPGVRPRARRSRTGSDLCRRPARCDDRCRRRGRDLDGPDLAADHAAFRLQPHDRHRRHHRFGHAGAGDPAVTGADRARRPAGTLGRRHVRRGDRAGPAAGRPVRDLRPDRCGDQAILGAGAAGRGAHLQGSERLQRPSIVVCPARDFSSRRLCLGAGARADHQPDDRPSAAGGAGRNPDHVDDDRLVHRARSGTGQSPVEARPVVEAVGAGDVRTDSAADPDLPGARARSFSVSRRRPRAVHSVRSAHS